MSTVTNQHGVDIKDVSVFFESFSVSSGIPSAYITPEVISLWKRIRETTLSDKVSLTEAPIDVTYSACWLHMKLEEIVDKDYNCIFTRDEMLAKVAALGSASGIYPPNTWKIAAAIFASALNEKRD